MKKIEKKMCAFTLVEIFIIMAIAAIVIILGYGAISDIRKSHQIKKEQTSRIIAVLGALEETITVKFYSGEGYVEDRYTKGSPFTIWSFHKLGDEYGQAPHTAKVVDGLIIELDGNPVQETLGPRLSGPKH